MRFYFKIKEETFKDEASLKSDRIQQHKDFLTEKRFDIFFYFYF
jgi:hypothetical protein